jgi:hypothetical protein
MVIADSFETVKDSLDTLVTAKTVSRVEIAGRKVIFYIDSLVSGKPLAFSFQVRALYPVRAEGPISHAYEYYDSKVSGYHHQGTVTVLPGPQTSRKFLRGDSNDDGAVDLSDAVSILGYLFLGVQPVAGTFCEDSGDVNDDGALNVTDPIALLQHLFLGGPAPAAPFPEEGDDPTSDSLRC